MKYFKTDGIRMKAKDLIFSLIPLRLGRILSRYSKRICIGFDTRSSSSEIFDLLVSGIITQGVEVISLGVCPTSNLSLGIKVLNCDYGIMVTASHNQYYDNGIKVFSSTGEKLNKLEEREIEELLDKDIFISRVNKLGEVSYSSLIKDKYISYLRELLKENKDIKVLFDTSNGVLSSYIDKVFKDKITYTLINNSPNGSNINLNCGSEYISLLVNKIDEGYDYIVSFDGDADRVVIINKNKELITGDDLIYLFTKEYKYKEVVLTKMSNLGLIEELKKEQVKVTYSMVGDNNVYLKMKETNAFLGGEPSGHLLFKDELVLNDGLLTFIKFLNIENKDVTYYKYLNKTINLRMLDVNEESISKIEENINSRVEKGRVFIRKSGTEDVLRINVQTINNEKYLEVIYLLKEYFDIDDKLLLL